MVSISLDMDWAPDKIIKDSVDLLKESGISATFFLTDPVKIDLVGNEIASHPNFLTGENHKAVLENIRSITPDSVGIRSHSLLTDTKLQLIFSDFGYTYSSNFFLDRVADIVPSEYCGLVELPIYFMDNLHVARYQGESRIFDLDCLKLDQGGLKIFVFHPTHIFLNLDNAGRHLKAKQVWKDPDALKRLVNRSSRGIRDLFIDLLDYINKNDIKTMTLKEIADSFMITKGHL